MNVIVLEDVWMFGGFDVRICIDRGESYFFCNRLYRGRYVYDELFFILCNSIVEFVF